MAGGFGSKFDPKWKNLSKNSFSSEVLKDSQPNSSPQKPENKPNFSLHGILGLNQTVELDHHQNNLENQSKFLYGSFNHLEKESQILLEEKQKELQKAIEELRTEIHQLAKATDNLEKDVEIVAATPIVEFNEYQFNFLQRIRVFIKNFRQNISEAGLWLESFSKKKTKRNYFWNTVKNKKVGGDQYLFSNEHSVARSAG